jgi:hypothetical protein
MSDASVQLPFQDGDGSSDGAIAGRISIIATSQQRMRPALGPDLDSLSLDSNRPCEDVSIAHVVHD